MKKFYFLVFFGMMVSAYAQVGIGTPTPEAALDVTSATNGFLVPRVALTAANTAAPVVNPQGTPLVIGTLVWNTAPAGIAPNNVVPGYHYWNGTRWIMLTTGSSAWNITGNSGTTAGTNFLGTTDAADLRIRTGGTDRWNISNANNGQMQSYALGTAAIPAYSFQTDPNTGIFSPSADALDFSTNGTAKLRIPNANQVHALSLGTALLPFYSFGADPNTGMFSSDADAIDFATNGIARFRIPNGNQVHALSLGTAALPFYSFSADTDTGIFSNTANTLGFATNGLERMRILNNSQVVVNNTGAPNATSVFSSYAAGAYTRAIYGFSGLAAGRGVVGESNTAGSAGVQGINNNAQGFGLWGYNANLVGTGTISAGQGEISTYLVDGSGGAFTGYDTGIYGFVSSPGDAQALLLQDDFGAQWNAGYFDTFTFSYYKILGDGSVSTTVRDTNGNKVVMHCTETPESLFEDYGTGRLVNGRVKIEIDPIFSKNILVDEKHPLKVFVQLEGECNGVYVTNKSARSFEVIELNGGTSDTPFSYSIVATRGEETYTSSTGQTRVAKYSGRFTPAPKFKTNARSTSKPSE